MCFDKTIPESKKWAFELCLAQIRFRKMNKNIFRLICSILDHILKIDEKFNSLLETIQTSTSKLARNNYNNIKIMLENSTNRRDNIFLTHKIVIKILNDFTKVRPHIVHKGYISHIVSSN